MNQTDATIQGLQISQIPDQNNPNQILKNYNYEQFLTLIQKMNYIENPLMELAYSSSAVVYYPIECCTPCRCPDGCDTYYRYNTLTNINGVDKFLFKSIVKVGCCCGFAYCKNYSLSSYEQYSGNGDGILSAEMLKESCCVFGCCSFDFKVTYTPENNRLCGIVSYNGCCNLTRCCKSKNCCCCKLCTSCEDCCYDYFNVCDVLNPNKDLVYAIYLRKCCIDCIPVDCCGYLIFTICDVKGNNVGEIKAYRTCCYCRRLCKDNIIYEIKFPPDATPDLKLTIINAVISLDVILT